MDDVARRWPSEFEHCILKIGNESVRTVLDDEVLSGDPTDQRHMVGRWARALSALADLTLVRWARSVRRAENRRAPTTPWVVFEGATGWRTDGPTAVHEETFLRAVSVVSEWRANWGGVFLQGKSKPD